MKNNNIELIENGLKCDNEKCDFSDKDIKSINYENWINTPCPKCGENLLTKEDFVNIRTLERAIAFTNSLSEEEIDKLVKNIDLASFNYLLDFKSDISNKKISVEVNTHKTITFGEIRSLLK